MEKNLSYAPDSFLWSQNAMAGGIYVTAVDANQAVDLMLREITRLQNEPLTAQGVAATVAQQVTSYYLQNETNAAQAGILAQYELEGGGWRREETRLERLRAVNQGDVQRVAKQYMHDLQFVVVGNISSIDGQIFSRQP